MTVYTSSEVQKRFSTLLKKALREGQVKFKTKDGQVFVIRPETPAKKSPFEVRSIKLPITKMDILDAIREGRARYS
ncbi:MAG: type II toxin-antitoxin system Phd/YefM family antitoxin [Anaerolineae bacterium]|nr:type II toxin-antitoxin system Phd/YefM family antitoxin [Anaerolineae bacterium]MCI0609492.1 type II toxin-antitoxin system Phd/YefM family antitoxin [Anaerolineae bacterium]